MCKAAIRTLLGRFSITSVLLLGLVLGGCDQTASSSNASTAVPTSNNVAQAPKPQTPPAVQPQSRPQPPVRDPHNHGNEIPVVLGQPPIEFDPPVLDLGQVRPNQRVSGLIYIQNLSDKALKILSSKADCTCTTVDLANTTIGPGERISFRADYNSSAAMGTKRSAVRVKFDGYDAAEVSITAFVTMPVKAEPPYIMAVPDQEGKLATSGEYVVSSLDQKPFRILAVNGAAPSYADFDPASGESRNTYTVKWDFSTVNSQTCLDSSGKRVPGWIVVETDHPECPVFDLEVRHECNRRPKPQPSDTWYMPEKRVLLGGVKAGQTQDFEVIVKWMPRKPMTDSVKTVISESPAFKVDLVEVVPQADGMFCKIRLTPTAGHKGLMYGTIRLHSNQQSSPIVVIGSVTE
jgi:hypothetical protein